MKLMLKSKIQEDRGGFHSIGGDLDFTRKLKRNWRKMTGLILRKGSLPV